MEQIKVGSRVIEIDVKRTKEFYKNYQLITEDCGCDYCSNYLLACDTFPKDIMNIFNLLGIDPRKEGEVYECLENEDGTHLYGGFYHIVGRIIDGPDLWIPTEEGEEFSSLGHNEIETEFNKDLALVPDDFPRPVIQFEFQMNVPWLLS
ncbi:hypothetical protein [Neobacillus drentensis]|uniref:hypothetical protein n=1 Tax=Neobacillus drentensis TaxID=220684 RepID=UPI002856FEB3|nr:hypothetical protein [Neobacillus drentensis]MDR7239148.1 hypothetical protein [Neobacillus drentensis]